MLFRSEDKIRHGLNNEMALEWAKIPRKPPTVGEQLALLREMGHAIEDVQTQRRPKGGQCGEKAPEGQSQGQQGKGKGKGKNGKPKGRQGGQQGKPSTPKTLSPRGRPGKSA